MHGGWAFVALALTRDPSHAVAVELDRELEHQGYVAVTSDYILDETLTFLNSVAGSRVTLTFLDGLLARVAAEDIRLVDVGPSRRDRAITLFRKLAPGEKRLSFTDATSFALMQALSIPYAFTADTHFHRAGRGIRPLVEMKAGRLSLVRLS